MTKEEYTTHVVESMPDKQIQVAFKNAASAIARLAVKYRISEEDYREAIEGALKCTKEAFTLGSTFGYRLCAQDFDLALKGEMGGILDG